MGLKKLYHLIKPNLGRDKFIELAKANDLLATIPKSFKRTTFAVKSSKYANLLVKKQVIDVNQVWVTDITYFRILDRFYYISLMMDLYSRKVISYCAAPTLEAIHSLDVLKNALLNRALTSYEGLIHHSDKGVQYFYNPYTELLEKNKIKISTCAMVLENSHAERLNGIIKNEYLEKFNIQSFQHLQKTLAKTVLLYNNERPHLSLNLQTPNEFEENLKNIPVKNRQILTPFTENKKQINKKQIELFQDV
jgi:putative transposase